MLVPSLVGMILRNTKKTPEASKRIKSPLEGRNSSKGSGYIQIREAETQSLLEVSNTTNYFIHKEILQSKVTRLRVGNIRNCYHQWLKITTDPFVLDVVKSGLRLDFFQKSCV